MQHDYLKESCQQLVTSMYDEYMNKTGYYKMTVDVYKDFMQRIETADTVTLDKLQKKLASIEFFNTTDTTIFVDDKTEHGIV
jgi:hypothetical protein